MSEDQMTGPVTRGTLNGRIMRSENPVVNHVSEDGRIEVYKWHRTFGIWNFLYVLDKVPASYEIID